MSGPDRYEGRDLVLAHKRLEISGKDFSLVAECLEETLDEAGLDEEDIAAIMIVVGSTRALIVSNDSG